MSRARDAAGLTFNVSGRKVRDAQELLRLDPRLADEVLRGTTKLSKALASAKQCAQRRLIEATPAPEGKFRTIVVDPPWQYDDNGVRGAAELNYATMSDGDIMALDVASLAANECHCYLWTTGSKLPVAFDVVRAWGFDYKTTIVWAKNTLGLGHYFRSKTEFALFATRTTLRLRENGIPNIFDAKNEGHSVKPKAFFDLVERASYPPRLEMFARGPREGWTTWGAEAGGRAPAPIHGRGVVIKPDDE